MSPQSPIFHKIYSLKQIKTDRKFEIFPKILLHYLILDLLWYPFQQNLLAKKLNIQTKLLKLHKV